MLRQFILSCTLLLVSSPGLHADIVDDFSSYGTALDHAEFGPGSIYQWSVANNVPTHSSTSLDINASGLKLAGYFHEPHSGYAGIAEAVFTPGNAPVLPRFELVFDVRERHDKLELDVNVLGKPSAKFIFSAVGQARIEFSNTSVVEYLNGSLIQSRSYASLGWTSSDVVRSFTFLGIHHDNGNSFAYVDNLAVTVPEPVGGSLAGSVCLLAITLGKRRRRDPQYCPGRR
jgi:hypothetical protein